MQLQVYKMFYSRVILYYIISIILRISYFVYITLLWKTWQIRSQIRGVYDIIFFITIIIYIYEGKDTVYMHVNRVLHPFLLLEYSNCMWSYSYNMKLSEWKWNHKACNYVRTLKYVSEINWARTDSMPMSSFRKLSKHFLQILRVFALCKMSKI